MARDFWLDKFRQEDLPVIVNHLRPERVLAFGSRARGRATEDSDLDIIIVSRCFSEIPFLQRMPMMLKLVSLPKHVDYLCCTPEEFGRIRRVSSIIMDALREPVELAIS
jgi:predicted nucleotidyltransferase